MSCDHTTLTDIVVEGKYTLVYCGGNLITGKLVTGKVTSAHTVELFDNVQGLIDRGVTLGLQCSDVDFLLRALEHGGVLPHDHMEYLHSVVWDADISFQKRMIALGYTKP